MIKNFIILMLVLALIFVLAIDRIAEIAVEKAWERTLGTKMDIGRVQVDLLEASIDMRNVKFYNPEGFQTELMADAPTIYLDFSPMKLVKKEFYMDKFELYIRELDVVRNSEGKVNLDLLEPVKDKKEGISALEAESGPVTDMGIGVFRLKADRAFYRNYTRPPEERITVFEVNIDEEYYNIRDPYTLVRLIIARVLNNTEMSGIISMPMNEVDKVLMRGTRVINNTAGAAKGLLKNSVDKIKQVL